MDGHPDGGLLACASAPRGAAYAGSLGDCKPLQRPPCRPDRIRGFHGRVPDPEMPGPYLVDPTRRLVLSRAWGVVSARDLVTHASALAADPLFHPSFRQLADLREVTDLDVDSSAIRTLASLSPFASGAQRALVVGAEVVYGMARMFQIL